MNLLTLRIIEALLFAAVWIGWNIGVAHFIIQRARAKWGEEGHSFFDLSQGPLLASILADVPLILVWGYFLHVRVVSQILMCMVCAALRIGFVTMEYITFHLEIPPIGSELPALPAEHPLNQPPPFTYRTFVFLNSAAFFFVVLCPASLLVFNILANGSLGSERTTGATEIGTRARP